MQPFHSRVNVSRKLTVKPELHKGEIKGRKFHAILACFFFSLPLVTLLFVVSASLSSTALMLKSDETERK